MSKMILLADFEYDFQLIGISSHAKDYRLSWELNKKFDINLVKEEEVVFSSKKSGIKEFSMYFYQDDLEERDVRLIGNKSGGSYLVPEKKAADFFLMLYDYNSLEINEMMREIRKINVVLTAFELDVNTLKSKENLLF
jgi:hypothetical protein